MLSDFNGEIIWMYRILEHVSSALVLCCHMVRSMVFSVQYSLFFQCIAWPLSRQICLRIRISSLCNSPRHSQDLSHFQWNPWTRLPAVYTHLTQLAVIIEYCHCFQSLSKTEQIVSPTNVRLQFLSQFPAFAKRDLGAWNICLGTVLGTLHTKGACWRFRRVIGN